MRLSWLLPALACLAQPVAAQSPAAPPSAVPGSAPLRIELNRIDAIEGACRLVLVAENSGQDPVDGMSVEAVLFDHDGRVALLTLLDLGALPAGRMRVRSFDLAGLDCGGLGRLLINAATCTPADAAACLTEPDWTSATAIEVRS
ncbi:MAG: hypothetical protein JJU19_15895 [Pararhodobacter sp.]|nr:hypothetical protein [Pararhodobacter sp.]